MKIGLIDLDTSHPQNWIPILRELGHEVACVWDGGSVHPAEYVAAFAKDHGIGEVCGTIEEVAEKVDCAIVHGCDWDTHVSKAKPFVDAGKSVLIDKPVAGTVKDLAQLQAWVDDGARITGGSSLRFCYETAEWLAQPVEERGTPDTVVCGCGVDEFNYGVHGYSMLAGIIGAGASMVQHMGTGVQRRVRVDWSDGRMGMLVIGQAKAYLPFYAQITTERGVSQIVAENKTLYRALLERVLPYLAGETDEPPVSFSELVEAERWALAAKVSWENGNSVVLLDAMDGSEEGYDGAAFAAGYRKSKYPDGQ